MTTDERLREEEKTPAPWSLPDDANLALGKYARGGSGRGHDARACVSEDVAQGFMGGRGEVVFVGLLVVEPGLRVPDLQVVNRSRHDAVLGQVGVVTVFGGQGDPALGVGGLFLGSRRQVAEERSRFRVAARCTRGPWAHLFARFLGVNRAAGVLVLGV